MSIQNNPYFTNQYLTPYWAASPEPPKAVVVVKKVPVQKLFVVPNYVIPLVSGLLLSLLTLPKKEED